MSLLQGAWLDATAGLLASPGLREVALLLVRGIAVVAVAGLCDLAAARRGSGALQRRIWVAAAGLLAVLGLIALTSVAEEAGAARIGTEMTWQEAPGSRGLALAWVTPLWLGVGCALFGAYLAGLARASWVFRHGATAADPELMARLEDVARRVGVVRPKVRITGRVSVPVAVGLWRGALLLPPRSEDLITRDVLAHEMFHLKHRDLAVQGVMRFALALSWFNPLVWLARRRFRRASEYACDDRVARFGDVAGYARTLVAWMDRGGPAVVGLALGRSGGTELVRRLERLVQAGGSPMGKWAGRAVVLAAALLGAAVVGGIRPPTPEFQFVPAEVPVSGVDAVPLGAPTRLNP